MYVHVHIYIYICISFVCLCVLLFCMLGNNTVHQTKQVGFSYCTQYGPTGNGTACGPWDDSTTAKANARFFVEWFKVSVYMLLCMSEREEKRREEKRERERESIGLCCCFGCPQLSTAVWMWRSCSRNSPATTSTSPASRTRASICPSSCARSSPVPATR